MESFAPSAMGRSNMAAAALMSVVLLGLARSLAAQAAESGWRTGRGTYYGNEPWLWSIHEGSCGYGYIWPDEPLGWDVAAMPDAHYEFDGSCGRCYEVACDPMVFRDNYGNELDRGEVCHDPSTTVVVRITDTCPCNYGDNYYSNKRWCCGDMDHLDLSVHTFEKLADMKWGVIGIKYRPVPCDYSPINPAPTPANPFPGVPPPPGAQKPWPPRFVTQKPNTGAVVTPPEDPKEALTPAPTEPEAMAFSLDTVLDGADAEEKTEPVVQAFSEDEQKPKKKPKKVKANKEGEAAEQEEGNEVEQEEASEEVTQEEVTEEVTQEEAAEEVAQEEVAQKVESKPALKGAVLAGDIDDAWTDSSWLVEETNGVTGPTGNMAHCKKISPGGAVAFSSYEGKFDKTISMEFWIKTDMGIPDLNINLEGPMGPCRRVKMQELAHSGRDQGGFVRYDLYLGLFDRTDDEMNTVHAFSSSFLGCGGNAVTDVNKIVFKNDLPLYAQEMCIDGVRLMAA